MVKGAWIQYLAVYYVVKRICRAMLSHFFESSLLMSFISDKS